MIDSVGKIYCEMRARSLTSSKADFSTMWLEKGEDHFHQQYNRVSLASKVKLYLKLSATEHQDLAQAAHAVMAAEVEGRRK